MDSISPALEDTKQETTKDSKPSRNRRWVLQPVLRPSDWRWSSKRKANVVLRFLRGENLSNLSHEFGLKPSEIRKWHDQFVAAGRDGLSLSSKDLQKKIREKSDAKLQKMELRLQIVEAYLKANEGASAAEVKQLVAEHDFPISVVCEVLQAPRSSVYALREGGPRKRGPKVAVSDDQLLAAVRKALQDHAGKRFGYKKIWEALRRQNPPLRVGKNRILRLMKKHRIHGEGDGGEFEKN